LKGLFRRENISRAATWAVKNAVLLLLLANLLMSTLAYIEAKEAKEWANAAETAADFAQGAAQDAARQAEEATSAARDAADHAEQAASEVSSLRLWLPFR
jgi:hypothetical protein